MKTTNELTLMQQLLAAGYPPEEVDHHESDLYVFVNPLTTQIIEAWCAAKNYARHLYCPIFRDQISGKLMYDCAFAFDPFWERKCG